jgi:hypothetical protein
MTGASPSVEPAKPPRIAALDQMRAIAIGGMVLAHFAPGVFDRVAFDSGVERAVLLIGRFATPAFIVVFGLTAGLVYASKYYASRDREVGRRLARRGWLLLGCALLITTPEFFALGVNGAPPIEWLYATYSVLTFYWLAVVTLPGWLWLAKSAPLVLLPLCGAALWSVSLWLGFGGWSYGENRVMEFIRMNLVSGGFGYLGLMGTTLLCMPLGLRLHAARRSGSIGRETAMIAVLGAAAFAAGLLLFSRSESTLEMIVNGDAKGPPRLWYFLLFGGIALLLFCGLAWLERRIALASRVLYPLTLAGQAALPIYLGHAFVLPAIAVLDSMGMRFEGAWRAAVPAALFATFCLVVIVLQHRRTIRPVRCLQDSPVRAE